MARTVIGIVAGCVAAFAIIVLVEAVGSVLFPQAAPLDWAEQAAVVDRVARVPIAAKLMIVAGWLLGAGAGAWLAGRIARRPAMGWLPAALVLLGGIANITMIPHPVWMAVAALMAPVLGGWTGVRIARSGRT